MKKNKIIMYVLVVLVSASIYAQNLSLETPEYNTYAIFDLQEQDKYYIGWLDKRGMITTLFFNYNFDLEKAFLMRDPTYNFDFSDVFSYIDTRIAKQIQLYRNQYFSLGAAGAVTAAILEKEQTINNVNFYTYDFAGEFAAYIDVYFQEILSADLKIRIYPIYHHSTHFVDGYKSEFAQMGASYEFFGLSAHYYGEVNKNKFSPYAGIETTYRHAGNGAPQFKAHTGLDYRYEISQRYDIDYIASFNVAYIHDHPDIEMLIDNPNHLAFAIGSGIEFHDYIFAIKYKYERGRDATTYFTEQSTLGIEVAVYF